MKKNKLLLTIVSPIISLFIAGALIGCNTGNNNSSSDNSSGDFTSVEVSSDGGTSLEEALIISFESNGGTNYYDVEYYGGSIIIPTPTKVDHNFLGWYDNENYTGDVYEGYLVPETNMTLYALWEEIDYPIVSFVTNSDNTTIDPIKYKGESLQVENPHKYGYEFTGWYTSSTFDEATKVNLVEFAPTQDVTLYANYKEVVYIHYFYGQYSDHKYFGYDQGTVVEVEDLYNPGPMNIGGVECPFTGWTYEDGTPVGNTVVLDSEVTLVATYNRKNAPMEHYLTEYDEGVLTATGNVAYEHSSHEGNTYFEVTMILVKGTSGGCGVAWRMDLSGNDYPYQDKGTNYLSAVLVPSSGALQIASVTDGQFAHMKGSVYAFNKLPLSWQEKYNSNDRIEVTLGVEDGGNYFNIYIDGELAFEYTDSAFLSNYDGTGFGIRCSSKGTDFKDFKYNDIVNVNFDSNGGDNCEPIKYVTGSINLPYAEKANSALEGWYYDEALTNKVDPDNFVATSSNMTLYANWTTDYYTVELDSNGGSELGSIRYNNGKIVIVDVPTKDNYIFTGWYYDKECTLPIDMDNPIITSNTTIYAGWDFPKGYVEKNPDGSYSITGKTAALHGITNSDGYIAEMEVSFTKGSSGAVGLMFNGTINADYNIESGQKYLSVQIIPASGGIQISRIDNGFAHLDTSKNKLTALPQAWQDKFNAAVEGDTVKGTIKVIVSDDCFRAYLDNELIFTTTEAHNEYVKQFTGNGYGLRSSVPAGTATYKISCKEYSAESLDVIRVTLNSDGSTINRYTEKGGTIPLYEQVGSSSTLANGNAETISYNWRNGDVIVDSNTTYSTHTVLTAEESTIITRGTHIVVTEDGNGKPVYTLQKSGGTTATPITIPDVEVNVGSISFDLTYTKGDNDWYHHFTLLGNIDNSTVYYPANENGKGTISFGWNHRTGTAYFSYVISNGSKAIGSSFVNVQGGLFNLAAFKTNYPEVLKKVVAPTANAEALPYGSEVTLNVKFVIENDGFKWYLDNCLLLTIGTVTLEAGENPCTSRAWNYVETTATNGSKAVANGPFEGVTATTQGAVINEFFHDAVANGYSTFGIRKYHSWDTGDVVIKNIVTTSSK